MESKILPRALNEVQEVRIETDLLIIGGGNSGCFVAIEVKEKNHGLLGSIHISFACLVFTEVV